jgi:hypothetical protein
LWYPAYENLFTIIRRFFSKKKLYQADQDHLHQMIYTKLKAINFINKKYLNTSTGIMINFFNFIIFLLTYKYFFSTQKLIMVIIFNLIIYSLLYFSLKKKVD